MIEKIRDLLPNSLMAGMKSWEQGSLDERVEILLKMYLLEMNKSVEKEIARLDAKLEDLQNARADGYTAGWTDGYASGHTAGFEDGFANAEVTWRP